MNKYARIFRSYNHMVLNVSKLAGMEMFVKVVESGSFSAAARNCDISPTMVSKYILNLEKRLGAQLLHRTTRRQQLTEVGRMYYQRCCQILAEIEFAEASAIELQEVPSGCLKMFAPVSYGTNYVISVLMKFHEKYPKVNIDLTLDNRNQDLLQEGFELGIFVGPFNEAGMVARPLKICRRVLAASPDYLLKFGSPDQPEQLLQHSCLGSAFFYSPNEWNLVGPMGETSQVFVTTGKFISNQADALRIAALHGAGIVPLPEILVNEDFKSGKLVPVLPGWSCKPSIISLVYAHDRKPTAKLRCAIDFFIEHLGANVSSGVGYSDLVC